MMNILAAPISGSATASRPPPDGQSDFAGGETRWSLVERKLLSPARKTAVECLVRLEQTDGATPHWRPGDLVELGGPPHFGGISPESFPHFRPGPRHAAVSLLAGGWPVWAGYMHRNKVKTRLPIASSADSGILDLLVFAGSDADPALGTEACQSLLFETTVNLRLLRSPLHWTCSGPLLFIGDLGAAALARAFLQESACERLFLIENGREDACLLSEAIFPAGRLRDGTVRALPRLADATILSPILEAHRRKIASLIDGGGQIIVAGTSADFLSVAYDGLSRFFGDEATAILKTASRLKKIAI